MVPRIVVVAIPAPVVAIFITVGRAGLVAAAVVAARGAPLVAEATPLALPGQTEGLDSPTGGEERQGYARDAHLGSKRHASQLLLLLS